MEPRMTFDDLWEQEELKGLTLRMQREYPAAQQRHRQRWVAMTAVAVIAVALVVFLTVQTTSARAPRGCDMVCCNRTTFSDSHWVDLAADMLNAEMR